MSFKSFTRAAVSFLSLSYALGAHADYKYTYESLPYEVVYGAGLTQGKDRLTIEIISPDLLVGQFSSADVQMTIKTGDFVFTPLTRPVSPPYYVWQEYYSFNAVDLQGLPTEWHFNYVSSYTFFGPNDQILQSSSAFSSVYRPSIYINDDIQLSANGGAEYLNVFGASYQPGSWKLEQIASSVPEPHPYGLVMIGVGFIGLLANRRKAIKLL